MAHATEIPRVRHQTKLHAPPPGGDRARHRGHATTRRANRPITHFLSAVHQALDLPAPLRGKDQLRYLKLLDQRARLARAGIVRLISNPHADALDYTSEGDHLRHVLADLPPDSYRHDPAERLPPDVEFDPVSLGMQRLPAGRGAGRSLALVPVAGDRQGAGAL